DEVRCAKVGLADAEIDDVAALRHELHGPRQNGEGILLADTIEGRNGFQHGAPRLAVAARQFNPIGRQMQISSAARRPPKSRKPRSWSGAPERTTIVAA